MIYTILTSLIILISKIRSRVGGQYFLRCDRPIPWHQQGKKWIHMSCCDCGLAHFFVVGHSGTAIRPQKYSYNLRFGAKAWTDPDPELGAHVLKKAKEAGVVKSDDVDFWLAK